MIPHLSIPITVPRAIKVCFRFKPLSVNFLSFVSEKAMPNHTSPKTEIRSVLATGKARQKPAL